MKIIRGQSASGTPLRIICSGCGKRAYAMSETDIFSAYCFLIGSSALPIAANLAQPPCEACLTVLERSEQS
jgi:hypothetical protein